MKFNLQPSEPYVKYTRQMPVLAMRAKLFRSEGCWWLEYEDGSSINLRHAAWGPNRYPKATMEKYITTGKM